jgi:hypothetical protein
VHGSSPSRPCPLPPQADEFLSERQRRLVGIGDRPHAPNTIPSVVQDSEGMAVEDRDDARVGVEPLLIVCDACGEQHPDDPSCPGVVADERDPWLAQRVSPANVRVMIRTPHPLPAVVDLGEL